MRFSLGVFLLLNCAWGCDEQRKDVHEEVVTTGGVSGTVPSAVVQLDIDNGKALYDEFCGFCHGAD